MGKMEFEISDELIERVKEVYERKGGDFLMELDRAVEEAIEEFLDFEYIEEEE